MYIDVSRVGACGKSTIPKSQRTSVALVVVDVKITVSGTAPWFITLNSKDAFAFGAEGAAVSLFFLQQNKRKASTVNRALRMK